MPRRAAVIWSAVEVSYLRKNRKAPLLELAGQLAKSVGAVKKKLAELKKDPNKLPLLGPTKNRRSRIGKRADCGGQFFRSSYEANVWRYYKNICAAEIRYEPETFTFTQHGVTRGQLSYTPDFLITLPGQSPIFVEVKGYMSTQDRTKLRRFKRFYPAQFSRLVGIVSKENTQAHKEMVKLGITNIRFYRDLAKEYRDLQLPGWES